MECGVRWAGVAQCLLFVLCLREISSFTSPPLILDEPDYDDLIVFEESQAATMPCRASGDPGPRYQWKKDDGPLLLDNMEGRISQIPGVGSFIFNNPKALEDQGFYQCLAENTQEGGKNSIAMSRRYNLRAATLDEFSTTVGETFTREFGEPLTIPCHQPNCFPNPIIIWLKYDVALSRYQQIDYDLRITVDFDGRLNFANLLKSDAGKYQCKVSNTFLLASSLGPDNVVSVSGTVSGGSTAPKLLWQNPTNEFTTRGRQKKVKCVFSGRPTPQVEWRRTDGDLRLPANVDREDRGQTLIFNDATYDNTGTYECRGVNSDSITPEVATIRLTVQSSPRYIPGWEPKSLTMGPGETAVIRCDGESTPDRKIIWYFNDQKLSAELTARYSNYTFLENSITIPNVTSKDVRNIHCNITNDPVGSLFKGVYLNVLNTVPEIMERPVSKDTWAAGQSRMLTCIVFGAPRPTVSWTLNDVPLTGGRFEIQEDGSLKIANVEVTDGGRYTCRGENNLGFDSATSLITIRRRTQIRTKPVDLTVIEGAEAKFTCTAVTDGDENGNLVIKWQKGGKSYPGGSSVRAYINVQDNSLIISGTTPLDAGDYTCHATNGLDYDEATATLRVQGRPSPPQRVTIDDDSCTQNRITISWLPGPNNNAPILNYVLQYNTSFEPETWNTATSNISLNKKTHEFILSPFVTYSFRVLARNKVGRSEPSEHTRKSCITPDALPLKNPTGIRTLNEEANKLIVTWQPVPRLDWNGADFRYIIRYKSKDRNECKPNVEWCNREVQERWPIDPLNPVLYQFTADETAEKAYEPYIIEMWSRNIVGPTDKKTILTGHAGESEPTAKIERVMFAGNQTTSYNVSLSWDVVDPNPGIINGLFRGYRVQYEKEGLADGELRWVRSAYVIVDNSPDGSGTYRQARRTQLNYVTVNGRIHTNVTNLPPYTDLSFRVSVINNKYAGVNTSPVTMRTLEGNPGPVESLSIVEYGPTHVVLNWTRPLEPNGRITRYEIGYQTVNTLTLENLQRASETNIPYDRFTAKLTGLKPLQRYRFIIWAYTKAGQGQDYYIEDSTIAPGYPGTPLMDVKRLPADNTLYVSWVAGTDGIPASVFYVQYRRDSALDTWDKTAWVSTRDFIILDGLSDGWQYEVRVVASNGGQYETPSSSEFIYPSASTRTAAEAEEVFTSAWFVAIIVGLIVLAVVLILICYIKDNKGGVYPGDETEKLMTSSDEDHRFGEYADSPREEKGKRLEAEEADSVFGADRKKKPPADDGHGAEGNYGEDGSYIGAYRNKEIPRYSGAEEKRLEASGQQAKPRPQARARRGADQESVSASEVSVSTAGGRPANGRGHYNGAGANGRGRLNQPAPQYDDVPFRAVESETESEAPSQYSTTGGNRPAGNYSNGRARPRPTSRSSRDDVSYNAAGGPKAAPYSAGSGRGVGSRHDVGRARSPNDEDEHTHSEDDEYSRTDQDDYSRTDRDDYSRTDRDDYSRTDRDDYSRTDQTDYTREDDDDITETGSYMSSQTASSVRPGPRPQAQQRGRVGQGTNGAAAHYGGAGAARGRGGAEGSRPQQQPRGGNRYSGSGGDYSANRYRAASSDDDGGASQHSAHHTVV